MDTYLPIPEEEKALPLPGRADRRRAREAAISKVKAQAKQKRARVRALNSEAARLQSRLKALDKEFKVLERDYNDDIRMIAQMRRRNA